MAKRKLKELDEASAEEPRRSSRLIPIVKEGLYAEEDDEHEDEDQAVEKVQPSKPKQKISPKKKHLRGAKKPPPEYTVPINPLDPDGRRYVDENVDKEEQIVISMVEPFQIIPTAARVNGRQYWLMKAEPETRIEKGKDIKFSIDDLASKSEPEPWDGIRNYVARNNLRAMKKGDLAFFYHSSCKVPAIVGIMEIVAEHTPDLTAHDPSAPYYDPKSKAEDPKWSVVHVKHLHTFKNPITLKEMKDWYSEADHPLSNMQMLRTSRLSVSKVELKEWAFLIGVVQKNGENLTPFNL